MTSQNQNFWGSALGATSSTKLNVKTGIIRTAKSAVRAKPLSLLQKPQDIVVFLFLRQYIDFEILKNTKIVNTDLIPISF